MRIVTVILTGGKSRRMGRDKGSLPVGDSTLLDCVIQRWRGVFDGVAVSVGQESRALPPDVIALTDHYRAAGPMAGLESALSTLDVDAVFLTAVDMPFGDGEMARHLVQRMGTADVCLIRRTSGQLEPLFALYRKTCLPVITRYLEAGLHSFLLDLFPAVSLAEVQEEELRHFDVAHALFNANRPEEWESARTLLGGGPGDAPGKKRNGSQ